jgi:hypothetical protein
MDLEPQLGLRNISMDYENSAYISICMVKLLIMMSLRTF